jgi:uncharacterized membrane protein
MHTEHLQNVHPIRILTGWMVALAVTGIAAFGFIALGLLGAESEQGAVWAMAAVAVGFLVGGWFTGVRTLEAPILHGIALGLTTLLVWAVLNVVVAISFGTEEWTGLGATATLFVLLVQVLAAVVGCWIGTRGARLRSSEVSASPAAGVRERGRD